MKYVIDMISNQRLSESAEIQNLYFPSSVESGVLFTISYDVVNLTANSLEMFGYIMIDDVVVPGTEWQETVQSYSVLPEIYEMSTDIQINGAVVIGHIEGDCDSYTNQTDCINAGCFWWSNGTCNSTQEPIVCSSYTNPTDCETMGCFWYNDSCHSAPMQEEINWMIPIAIMGTGLIMLTYVLVTKPVRRRV